MFQWYLTDSKSNFKAKYKIEHLRGVRYHTILYAYISCYYNTTQSIYRKLVVTIPKQHLHSSNIQPFEEVEEEEVKQLMLMVRGSL